MVLKSLLLEPLHLYGSSVVRALAAVPLPSVRIPSPEIGPLEFIQRHAPKPANTHLFDVSKPPELPLKTPGRIGLPGILGAGAAVAGILGTAYELYQDHEQRIENEKTARELWRLTQIGIDRVGKSAEQVAAELVEAAELMRRAAILQFEIQKLKLLSGTEGQIQALTDELEGLQIQMHTAAKAYPVIGGALTMVASADGSASLPQDDWQQRFLEDTRSDVEKSPFIGPDDREKLNRILSEQNPNDATIDTLAQLIDDILLRDFINKLRQTPGVFNVVDDQEAGYISVYYHDTRGYMPTRRDPNLQSLEALLEAYQVRLGTMMPPYSFTLYGEQWGEDITKGVYSNHLRIPKPSLLWRIAQDRFQVSVPTIEYVAREVNRNHVMQSRFLGRVVVALRIAEIQLLYGDLNLMVHPWVFAFHDWYHAICVAIAKLELREMAAQLYRVMEESMQEIPSELREESGLDVAMGQLLDLQTDPDDGLDNLLADNLWFLLKGWLRVPSSNNEDVIQRHRLAMDVFHRLERLAQGDVFTGEHAEAQREALSRFLNSVRARYGMGGQ